MFAGCIVKVKEEVFFAYTMNVSFIWHPFVHQGHMLSGAVQAELKGTFSLKTVKYDCRVQSV